MTIADIIRANVDTAKVQLLHECALGAKLVNARGTSGAKKGHTPYTRVEFATENMTPDDLMYFAEGCPSERKPRYLGMVVWVPFEAYESATNAPAVVAPVDDATIRPRATETSSCSPAPPQEQP